MRTAVILFDLSYIYCVNCYICKKDLFLTFILIMQHLLFIFADLYNNCILFL